MAIFSVTEILNAAFASSTNAFNTAGNYLANAIGIITAAGVGIGTSKRVTATVGTSALLVTPPTGTWKYLKVINTHATAVVSVGVNEVPVVAPGAAPVVANDWQIGYDIGPGGSELIPISGALSSIYVLSDTASTNVVLNVVA